MGRKNVQHRHPMPVAVETPDDPIADTPFAEGKDDGPDPNLRHRLISERACTRYREWGYADGCDLDVWLEAEAEVDHPVLYPVETA